MAACYKRKGEDYINLVIGLVYLSCSHIWPAAASCVPQLLYCCKERQSGNAAGDSCASVCRDYSVIPAVQLHPVANLIDRRLTFHNKRRENFTDVGCCKMVCDIG